MKGLSRGYTERSTRGPWSVMGLNSGREGKTTYWILQISTYFILRISEIEHK